MNVSNSLRRPHVWVRIITFCLRFALYLHFTCITLSFLYNIFLFSKKQSVQHMCKFQMQFVFALSNFAFLFYSILIFSTLKLLLLIFDVKPWELVDKKIAKKFNFSELEKEENHYDAYLDEIELNIPYEFPHYGYFFIIL